MEAAGITPTTPLQRAATAPVKRKTSGDGEVEIKRMAAAASIRPGWKRQDLKYWDPIAEKPQLDHLKAAAKERAEQEDDSEVDDDRGVDAPCSHGTRSSDSTVSTGWD